MTTPQPDAEKQRALMVAGQIASRGIRDGRVLRAMNSIPREVFIAAHLEGVAYADSPLPIESGQTISQPYIVAKMAEALELHGDETVLEVGTGSGYAAAVLGALAKKVITVERHGNLADRAARTLQRLGMDNVEVHVGDGTLGWPADAPYDAITVAAAGASVPEALLAQLKEGGRLVIPIGSEHHQDLLRITKDDHGQFHREKLESVRFVPLVAG